MKILAITQARIGSTRLPEKILKTINNVSLLEIHLTRILKSKLITTLKIATTIEPDATKIIRIANSMNIEVHQGSVDNVLDRFYETAVPDQPDWVVRLTSDCPLIDPTEIDRVIQFAIDKDLDYASNALQPTFPDGLDTEVFKFSVLKKAWHEAKLTSELEHVTPYIWKNSNLKGGDIFKAECLLNAIDYSNIRLTVDTQEDFEVIKKLVEIAGIDKPWLYYVDILQKNPDIKALNSSLIRNAGYQKSILNDKTK